VLLPGPADRAVVGGAVVTPTAERRGQGEGGDGVDGVALQQHCRRMGLAGYKLPRIFVWMEALPLNSTGKVMKQALQERMRQHMVSQQQQQQQGEEVHGIRSRL
jgi:acyl-CoA synthetase (AMP-forming)/AMP-acid ligase II